MIVYYIPLVVLLIAAFFDFADNLGRYGRFVFQRLFSFFALLFLAIICAFKGDVDPDYQSYFDIFNLIPSLDDFGSEGWAAAQENTDRLEPAFIAISSIVKYFGGGYRSVLIIFSIIFFFLTLFSRDVWGKEGKYVALFVLVASYYSAYFTQIRFLAASLLCYLVLFFYTNNKRLLALILMLLAVLFHNASWLMLLPFFLFRFRETISNRPFLLVMVSIPFAFFSILPLFEYLGSSVFLRYGAYVEIKDEFLGSSWNYYWRLLFVLFFLGLLRFREKNLFLLATAFEKMLFVCVLLGLYIWAVGHDIPILYRAAWFFDWGYLFFVAAFMRSKHGWKKMIFFLCMFVYLGVRVNRGLDGLEPYYMSLIS